MRTIKEKSQIYRKIILDRCNRSFIVRKRDNSRIGLTKKQQSHRIDILAAMNIMLKIRIFRNILLNMKNCNSVWDKKMR